MYNTPILKKFSSHDLKKRQILESDYSISFSSNTENYCVGMVDMINSTKISASLGVNRASKYYEIFLNSMAKLVNRFGGFVIKNMGDCLLYYFPESINSQRKFGLMNCLESSLTMIEYHDFICDILKKENLPPVDYRISLDYGSVVMMRSNISNSIDMIGTPINVCSKINRCAPSNGVVLGGDLFEIVKRFEDYCFKEIFDFSLGLKKLYSIYSVRRNN